MPNIANSKFYTIKDFKMVSYSFIEMSRIVRGFSSRLKLALLFLVIRETSAGDDETVLFRVSLSLSLALSRSRSRSRFLSLSCSS